MRKFKTMRTEEENCQLLMYKRQNSQTILSLGIMTHRRKEIDVIRSNEY